MRAIILAASFAALVGFAGVASAQTTGTTGTASASNAVTVNAYTGTGNGSTGTAGTSGTSGSSDPSGGGTTNIKYSGHEYSTPSVQGSYFAGANPCLVGVGASGAGGPIGLSFTFGRNDEGCQRRSDAAAWHALGHDDVAVARMCQDDDNRQAFESLGMVCPQDRPKTTTVAMVAPVAPMLAAAPPAPAPAPVQVAALPPTPRHPDWCDTVTGVAERASHKQVCGF